MITCALCNSPRGEFPLHCCATVRAEAWENVQRLHALAKERKDKYLRVRQGRIPTYKPDPLQSLSRFYARTDALFNGWEEAWRTAKDAERTWFGEPLTYHGVLDRAAQIRAQSARKSTENPTDA